MASELQAISGRLERGEIGSVEFLGLFTRFVAQSIGCSRVGVWVFRDNGKHRSLRCVAMFDATLDRMLATTEMVNPDVQIYFETLLRDGSIIAPDAPRHPALQSCREYFEQADVRSAMDVSFSVNGVLFGAFSCEQVGQRVEWNQRQLQLLRKIGSRASLTLMHAVSDPAEDDAPGSLWENSGSPSRLATLPAPLEAFDEPERRRAPGAASA